MSDIIKEAFNNIDPAARERVRIKTNIMDNQTLREKALEMAVKAAQAEGYHPDKIVDIANQFYEFLKGEDGTNSIEGFTAFFGDGAIERSFPKSGMISNYCVGRKPNDKDIEIACEILSNAGLSHVETQHIIKNGTEQCIFGKFDVCGDTLKIS